MSAANTYKASSPDRAPLSDPWAVQSDAAAHAHDRPAGAADTLRRHASAAASTVRVHLARVEAATEDELRLYLGRGFEAVCVLLALASISFALHAVLSQHTVLLSSVNAFTLALALAGIAHARQLERWGLARTLDMYCLFLATVQGRAALLVTLGFLQGTSNVWGWCAHAPCVDSNTQAVCCSLASGTRSYEKTWRLSPRRAPSLRSMGRAHRCCLICAWPPRRARTHPPDVRRP